jgi:DNA-binding NtrC family response regulator
VVEDDFSLRWLVQEALARRIRPGAAEVLEDATGGLLEGSRVGAFSLVILDADLGQGRGWWHLLRLRRRGDGVPVMLMSIRNPDPDFLARSGAVRVLVKPFGLADLSLALAEALPSLPLCPAEATPPRGEASPGPGRARPAEGDGVLWVPDPIRGGAPVGMVVSSPPMRKAVETARQAASTDSTVLIEGESGTGKELLARAIHEWSGRNLGPFVAVNSAALPENLLESELFGHEKGAFTGAHERKLGRFDRAHGGTLFLDEVGDMSPGLQAKLLRVLQERSFERVGGRETVAVDVRVIAATNRKLARLVSEGRFREDLYWRLHVVPIDLPPLSERREDIPLLVKGFLERSAARCRRPAPSVSEPLLARLMAHSWPGNIRELENAIERLIVLGTGAELEAELLPDGVAHCTGPAWSKGSRSRAKAGVGRDKLVWALKRTAANRSATAKILGISRRYVQMLIRRFCIKHGEL